MFHTNDPKSSLLAVIPARAESVGDHIRFEAGFCLPAASTAGENYRARVSYFRRWRIALRRALCN
jgi:hypothetical protein